MTRARLSNSTVHLLVDKAVDSHITFDVTIHIKYKREQEIFSLFPLERDQRSVLV
jgi:hypothetical protein